MITRDYNLDECARILANRDNPKTMDYLMWHLIVCHLDHALTTRQGHFSVKIRSRNQKLATAFDVLETYAAGRYRYGASIAPSLVKAETMFVLNLLPEKILPKSRTLRIISKKYFAVPSLNPLAGQDIEHKVGVYTYKTPQPLEIVNASFMYLYSRNKWDRKNALKLAEEEDEEEHKEGALINTVGDVVPDDAL